MRRALTQSVPRRGLSHIQGRTLRLTPPRGRRRGRGLCCTGALRAQGRGSFQRLCAGRRPQPINRPAVGRKGLPRLRRRRMKRPPWQAGRLTWGLVCMMCRMRQGLFCTAPAGAGLSRAQGRGSFQRLCAGRRPQPINRPAVGRKGLPRLRRRRMKRPPWQAGRLTWGLVCMMCRMRQGLFCTAPAGTGAFPRTGARPAPDAARPALLPARTQAAAPARAAARSCRRAPLSRSGSIRALRQGRRR